MTDSISLLDRLIAFPTVSDASNMELIEFVRELLERHGVDSDIVAAADGAKANLFATIGPKDRPGVMLSGHTDVVPSAGQAWSRDPFVMAEADGRLYGRGSTDMKGFIACALHAAVQASRMELETPLHIALSYDEEIGCIGVRRLIEVMAQAPVRPMMCIVGEPTLLKVATAHKGKVSARVRCIGEEAHSSLAPEAVNAIHLAADLIGDIRNIQAAIERNGARDGDYDVPFTTLHVGNIAGGTALNIVPGLCTFEFEIRNLAEDDPDALLGTIRARAAAIAEAARAVSAAAAIAIDIDNRYPGLDTPPGADVVQFVKSLSGANATVKLAYGTEGGLFDERLSIPTVVCGPGSMAQGHKPDEFIARSEMERCDAMLGELLARLRAGI